MCSVSSTLTPIREDDEDTISLASTASFWRLERELEDSLWRKSPNTIRGLNISPKSIRKLGINPEKSSSIHDKAVEKSFPKWNSDVVVRSFVYWPVYDGTFLVVVLILNLCLFRLPLPMPLFTYMKLK